MEVMLIPFGMWITVVFLATWLPSSVIRKAIGLGAVTDITIHLVLQFFFGGTGAERVGLLIAGVMLNVTMHLYKYLFGWETIGGTFHPGKLRKSVPASENKSEAGNASSEKYSEEYYRNLYKSKKSEVA